MAGREDSRSPIRLARLRNLIFGETRSRWQLSRILWTFSVGSDINMGIDSMLKPGMLSLVLESEGIT